MLFGIRNNLVEIGGSFNFGLSRLSSDKLVFEVSKSTSNLLKFPNEDDNDHIGDCYGVLGVTGEVLEFVKEITRNRQSISFLCKLFLLSLVGITLMQNCVITGVNYSSPTLASVLGNLIPAFTLEDGKVGCEKFKKPNKSIGNFSINRRRSCNRR